MHKTATVGANWQCLIYNLLIVIVFPKYFGISQLEKLSVEDVINLKGLVALTEYQMLKIDQRKLW